jgi:acetyl-CoA carboxylase biotin carboxyl carrier protein
MKDVTGEEIKTLIEMFDDSDWKELSLQVEDFSIFLSRDAEHTVPGWLAQGQTTAGAAIPERKAPAAPGPDALQPEAVASDSAAKETVVPEGAVVITAPNLGIFYRAPKPGAPPYVNTGDKVEADTEICLIEVMKLFTPVTAGVKGVVLEIRVADGEMIEHGHPLFYIQPE